MAIDLKLQEKVYATYLACGNYRKTGKKCGVATRTCYDIVKRLGGDELADIRLARKADLAEKLWKKVPGLVAAITIPNLGIEGKSSLGLEAAKALDSLSRVIGALEHGQPDALTQPTTINVNVSMKPPHERVQVTDVTTTTLLPAPPEDKP